MFFFVKTALFLYDFLYRFFLSEDDRFIQTVKEMSFWTEKTQLFFQLFF